MPPHSSKQKRRGRSLRPSNSIHDRANSFVVPLQNGVEVPSQLAVALGLARERGYLEVDPCKGLTDAGLI